MVLTSALSDDLSNDAGQLYLLYLNNTGQADSVFTLLNTFNPGENNRMYFFDKLNGDYFVSSPFYTIDSLQLFYQVYWYCPPQNISKYNFSKPFLGF